MPAPDCDHRLARTSLTIRTGSARFQLSAAEGLSAGAYRLPHYRLDIEYTVAREYICPGKTTRCICRNRNRGRAIKYRQSICVHHTDIPLFGVQMGLLKSPFMGSYRKTHC